MEHYGGEGLMPDMREYINIRPTHFQLTPPPPLDIYAAAAAAVDYRQEYEVPILTTTTTPSSCSSVIHHQLRLISNSAATAAPVLTDTTAARWPREETLTLLDIRSGLDSKFKISNHKGPLWDEVSRIMATEHGYYRSGKKCREKFGNLYKYYKKTKDGKAGRQDGKHYRFFRQLESLYGGTDHTPPLSETRNNPFHFPHQNVNSLPSEGNLIAQSNSSGFGTSSSDDDDEHGRCGRRRSWKVKIARFIDLQMRKLMEKQEEWLEKVMKTIERKERERMLKEEEWIYQEAARVEKEHEFWAKERAWIEARNASIMDSFQKIVQNRDMVSIANAKIFGSRAKYLGPYA